MKNKIYIPIMHTIVVINLFIYLYGNRGYTDFALFLIKNSISYVFCI